MLLVQTIGVTFLKDYELSKNGKEQSPINITGAEDVDLPELNLNNQESEAQVENNGHTIEVSFKIQRIP